MEVIMFRTTVNFIIVSVLGLKSIEDIQNGRWMTDKVITWREVQMNKCDSYVIAAFGDNFDIPSQCKEWEPKIEAKATDFIALDDWYPARAVSSLI
jgi:hypothetical protein